MKRNVDRPESGRASPSRTGRFDSYLICATPRTGSTLLCGLLASTTVAGRPESYFREADERSWTARWDIARSPDGAFSYSEFVRAALAAGRTGNAVFAARVMWGTLDRLVDRLGSVNPASADGDLLRLNLAFGHTGFIHLRRDDVLAQAVSWHRAEQTNVWHRTGPEVPEETRQAPQFDFDQIRELARTIEEHNAAWRAWFAGVGIRPHVVRYEDLDADPLGVVRGVLDFLGLELPLGRMIETRHRRLADDLNAEWIDRYRAESAERSIPCPGSGKDGSA